MISIQELISLLQEIVRRESDERKPELGQSGSEFCCVEAFGVLSYISMSRIDGTRSKLFSSTTFQIVAVEG